ncbi:hypothetical protein H8356DRAFT_1358921 [Neocallimastix lanati (nom. inval.)]|nr:hypothetical protein H8356DRAFT_1358921 [Neocallimastix sp. JGI-2020a]
MKFLFKDDKNKEKLKEKEKEKKKDDDENEDIENENKDNYDKKNKREKKKKKKKIRIIVAPEAFNVNDISNLRTFIQLEKNHLKYIPDIFLNRENLTNIIHLLLKTLE